MKENTYKRIDVHCHLLTNTYKKLLAEHGIDFPDGVPMPTWTIENQLKAMAKNGVSHCILSISSPPINFGDDNIAKEITRKVNEETAEYVRENPDKLSFMGSLPLPNVEYSIQEANYCIDTLSAAGFTLPTNVLGVYLGNPVLDPLMDILNDKKAVIAIHPTAPSMLPQNINEGIPIPLIEFFFDTSRTVINLMMKNVFARYPNIKWIIPHAGAVIPILSDRIQYYAPPNCNVYKTLGNLYYDLAGACTMKQLGVLLKLTTVDQLLYGTDFPFTNSDRGATLLKALETAPEFTNEDHIKIFQENPKKLFPQLS